MARHSRSFTGFLFDLYAQGGEMVLWFLADDGRAIRLVDPFAPEIYISGPTDDVDRCARALARAGDAAPAGWVERLDFWTGQPRPVFAVSVLDVENWHLKLPRHAAQFPAVAWYNADLPPEQMYGYARNVFPLARCAVRGRDGHLESLEIHDERWSTTYDAPPFRAAHLAASGSMIGPRPRLQSITLTHDAVSREWDDPETMFPSFQAELDRLDPDVIFTDNGDDFVMPLLLGMAHRAGFPLRFDRDPPPRPRPLSTEGRSYFSYGRILYQSPDYPLRGRWHLDRANSFMIDNSGLDGLIEVSRISRIPIQRTARRSIGTAMSSIQFDLAWRDGFLVPWRKTHPEAWKTARQLLVSDRGGLVYAPEIGFHERVVELDFVSMYPSIMTRFNVSPETVNCACCGDAGHPVPEIGYATCRRRRGLVSRALEPIIERRVEYKAFRNRAKAAGDTEAHRRYDERQSALKWILVCCFGYLGYRNARFGRIEAHETVSAYSREMLTRAREVCEDRGWRMLHANVDSVYLVKPGFAREEIDALCAAIDEATNLRIAVEGVYRWVAFLPSRQYDDRPVPTRLFGAFENGEVKYRGIECRRHDLPPFVREVQLQLLKCLAPAEDRSAFRAALPGLLQAVAEQERALWGGRVALERLVMRQTLSKAPEDYRGNGAQAIAARQAARAGLPVHPGQTLEYIFVDNRNPIPDQRLRLTALWDPTLAYDAAMYVRLLRRAANTLLWPVGVRLDEDDVFPPGAFPPPRNRRQKKRANPLFHQMDLFEEDEAFANG